MNKIFASSLVALAAVAASGTALAQGINPYAAGLNGLNAQPVHSYLGDVRSAAYGVNFKAEREIQFKLGTDIYQEDYTEYAENGDKVMNEKGILYGLHAGVDLPVGAKGTLALDAVYAVGESEYTGSYMGGSYGDLKIKDLDRKMYKVSAAYKHQFASLADTTIGAGIDYRVLVDRLDQAGDAGYRRENQSLWAHLSIERDFDLGDAWTVTPQAKVSYLIRGRQKADLLGGMNFEQKKGHGAELAVGVTREFKNMDLTVKPYFRYTDVRDSQANHGFYEPRNKTKEVGVQLTMTF